MEEIYFRQMFQDAEVPTVTNKLKEGHMYILINLFVFLFLIYLWPVSFPGPMMGRRDVLFLPTLSLFC